MFSAPTRSAWSVYPQRTHWNFSCVGRFSSATCPQSLRGQVREVLRGSTGISLRPALSALCARMPRNPPQPASWMLLFTPGLRASPVREKRARVAGVGLGLWRADHVRDAQPFVRDHVVLADYRQGGLVRVILPLAAHRAMQRGDLLHRTAMPGGSVVPLAPGERRQLGAGRRRGHRRGAWRAGGSTLCSPLAVVRKWAMPMSIPVTAPVAGSGSAGTSSQARMT